MAQRNSLRPVGRRGLVAMVVGAIASMMHRGQPVLAQADGPLPQHAARVNWLKGSLIQMRTAPGARGG